MKNTKTILPALLVIGLSASLLCQSAFAAGRNFANNHPRRGEVVGRDNHLDNRLENHRGQFGGNYGKFMAQDQRIQHQEQRDARINGGFITKGQQAKLNREENHLSQEMRQSRDRFKDNHPRRNEVMGRTNNLSNQLRQDKGQLGGNYGNLMAQDKRIRNQERRDARINGGFITKGQQAQLNREENHLKNKISRNYHN